MNYEEVIAGLNEDFESIENNSSDRLTLGRLVSICARLTSLAENQGDRIIALESDLEQAQITLNELQGLCYSCGKNSADKDELCWECEQRQHRELEREASMALATDAKAISDDDQLE